jgi:hypothetical protein
MNGPYMNDDGDLWYPRGDWRWNEAQAAAASEAHWTVGDWAKAEYEGITTVRVSDEREDPHLGDCREEIEDQMEEGEHLPEDFEPCCRTVEAYHFRVVEP